MYPLSLISVVQYKTKTLYRYTAQQYKKQHPMDYIPLIFSVEWRRRRRQRNKRVEKLNYSNPLWRFGFPYCFLSIYARDVKDCAL